MLEAHLRQAATVLLESAIRLAPPDAREWGRGMLGELGHVEGAWAAVRWALGGITVMAKHTLLSFLIPRRRGHGTVLGGDLFAKNVSLRKAALAAGGACVLGALLFFAAPPFRQGIRVSLTVWREVFQVKTPDAQPGLAALSKRAETRHDPEALAFVAVRLRDGPESARLAAEAVRLDPTLVWVYALVAVRHPEFPQIGQWVSELKRRDPQNALFHLITAESIDIAHLNKASRKSPKEAQRELEEDPAWQSAMAAGFASPRFHDYLDDLKEVDRRTVSRYRFDDPYELLSGEEADLPTYAFWDCQRFAQSLLQAGQTLEGRGDRRGAAEKYWMVARFGQVLDAQASTSNGRWVGTSLQALAYKQLQTSSARRGNLAEAALFRYLAEKFDAAKGERAILAGGAAFGLEVARRNAAVVQISGLMIFLFAGLAVAAASILLVGGRRGAGSAAQRAKPVATMVVLASAVGLLFSSATLYLTYRPYWYIFQRAVRDGNISQAHDLRHFLMATQVPPGVSPHGYLWVNSLVYSGSPNFLFYFWSGVTLIGLIGLVLILLRHFLGRPRARTT
jgi:hypothetical protein